MNNRTVALAALMAACVAGNSHAGSLEGVWELESGRWPGDAEDLVYPGNPAQDEGSMAYRLFTGNHHVLISSAPAMDVYNATLATYSVDGNVLKLEKLVAKSPKHQSSWTWTFTLSGDRLTLETDGMEEVWRRVE